MDRKESNRKRMPNVADLIDEIREANPSLTFKVIAAEDFETGVKVGQFEEEREHER